MARASAAGGGRGEGKEPATGTAGAASQRGRPERRRRWQGRRAAKKVREAEVLLTVREVWKYEVEAMFCGPLIGNLMGREKGRRGRLWVQKREYRNKGKV